MLCSSIDCEAYGINDRGMVVGTAGTGTGYHDRSAYVWFRGFKLDTGNLGGRYTEAYDINNRHQVVGFSTGTARQHGFLWQRGKMVAIENLIDAAAGWTISDARHQR